MSLFTLTLRQRPRPQHMPISTTRTFTSSPCVSGARHTPSKSVRAYQNKPKPVIPPYPFPAATFYKQSNLGLYGHQKIRFGNMVSEKNEIKTRRYWRPNVQQKRMWSGYLNTFIRTRITTRIIRTVDKVGGLDEYLLGNSKGRIKELGVGGWKLRWRVMQTQGAKQRFREERLALGLPEHGELGEFRGMNGELVAEDELQNQMDAFDAVLGEEELEMGESEAQNEGFMREDPVRKDDKVIL